MSYIEGSSTIPAESLDHRIAAMAEQLWNIHCLITEVLAEPTLAVESSTGRIRLPTHSSECRSCTRRCERLKALAIRGVHACCTGTTAAESTLQHGQISEFSLHDAAIGDPYQMWPSQCRVALFIWACGHGEIYYCIRDLCACRSPAAGTLASLCRGGRPAFLSRG